VLIVGPLDQVGRLSIRSVNLKHRAVTVCLISPMTLDDQPVLFCINAAAKCDVDLRLGSVM